MLGSVMRAARVLKAVADEDTDGVDESDTAHPRMEKCMLRPEVPIEKELECHAVNDREWSVECLIVA